MSDRIGAVLLILLGAVIAAWCIREYRREQAPGQPDFTLDDAYALIAAHESRNVGIEWWLYDRNGIR